MASLENKVIIVTGAGSGFGAEIARRASQRGVVRVAQVVLCDISEKGLQATSSSITAGSTLSIVSDVTKLEDWEKITKEAVEKFGKIDSLINNAGWSYKNQQTLTVAEADFDRCFDINVKSIFLSVGTVIAQIKKQGHGGTMINVSSVSAQRPRPGLTWYSASKGAVTVATKALASDFAPDNIRVNCVSPVLTATGLFEAFSGVPATEENMKKFLGNIPLGRLGSPGDVAETSLFLASDNAQFLTGVDIPVDGGRAI